MSEYGLFMLKPDGVKRELENDFLCFLKQKNIEILDRCEKKLNKDDVQKNFFPVSNEYQNYLTSGNSVAFFVRINNDNVSDFMGNVKMEYRALHGITNEMHNILHKPDDGVEYYLQKKLFFPQYNTYEYSLSTDMLLCCSSEIFYQKMQNIIEHTNLKCVFMVLENYYMYTVSQLFTQKLKIKYVIKKNIVLLNGVTVEVLYILKDKTIINENVFDHIIKDTSYYSEVVVLGKISESQMIINESIKGIEDLSEIYNYIREKNELFFNKILMELGSVGINKINGILVERHDFDLVDSVARYIYAEDKSLFMIAGSGSEDEIGRFSVTDTYMNNYEIHMKRSHDGL